MCAFPNKSKAKIKTTFYLNFVLNLGKFTFVWHVRFGCKYRAFLVSWLSSILSQCFSFVILLLTGNTFDVFFLRSFSTLIEELTSFCFFIIVFDVSFVIGDACDVLPLPVVFRKNLSDSDLWSSLSVTFCNVLMIIFPVSWSVGTNSSNSSPKRCLGPFRSSAKPKIICKNSYCFITDIVYTLVFSFYATSLLLGAINGSTFDAGKPSKKEHIQECVCSHNEHKFIIIMNELD